MVKYIIKINCTDKSDLAFNKKKLQKNNPPDLILDNISSIFPYIKNIKIIHKKLYKFTTKTLEFYCEDDNELSDDDFIHFIEVLKKLSFSSDNNTKVRYVTIINDIDDNNVLRQKHKNVLIYNFTSLEEIEIKPQGPRKPNHFKYMTELLYVCKNLQT
jgi:hypothetical protein